MHQQIRTRPARSPDNLQELLDLLSRYNLEAVGGSNVETGGEFAFAVRHDLMEEALQLLIANGYQDARIVDVDVCWLEDREGQLLECINGVRSANATRGGAIRDFAIGGPQADGIPVQVYSESATTQGPSS
jgi:hypothetical protein